MIMVFQEAQKITPHAPLTPVSYENNFIGISSKFSPKILQEIIIPNLAKLGYELIALDAQTGKNPKLKIFIDFPFEELHPNLKKIVKEKKIGLDDCIKVSRLLDPILDQSEVFQKLFKNSYELEVSSPGLERPLQRKSEFARFKGERAQIQTLRPLTVQEIENENYYLKNKKQKKFIGTLDSSSDENVTLVIDKNKISIPLSLITKAHLIPNIKKILSNANKKGNRKA